MTDTTAVIRAAYRQVFGNAHLMDEERSASAESLYVNGDLTVQGLVTALAQSDTYRRLFLEKNGPYRFVELNFKHLLGRAPHSQAEVSEHVQRLANEAMRLRSTATPSAMNTSGPLASNMSPRCVEPPLRLVRAT